jgi:hypothetical protein
MFKSKDEVTAMYAMYKALEAKQIEIKNHGAFKSLETMHNGAEGFWLFEIENEPVFIPKFVVELLAPAAMRRFHPSQEVATPAPLPAPTEAPLAVGWESPDIQRRLNEIVVAVQSTDTRYVRVISKTKTGKQETRARIAQGTNPGDVVNILMHVRRRSKDPTVMAEVLNVRLKRTLARSFPLELAGA